MSEFLHSILYSQDSGYASIRCIILAAACYAIRDGRRKDNRHERP